jgi:uncharacterized membrane protein YuzA (DUF378 family)
VRRNPIDRVAGALVIIGALNWGFVGLIQLDLVATLFGAGSTLARIVYVLVGLAGIYPLVRAFAVPRDPGLERR